MPRSKTYLLRVSSSASRQIAEELPEPVAAAVIEFITGPLIENPERVGGPLQRELAGKYAARRGTFRIIYRIEKSEHAVYVEWIMARSDIYKPR